MCAASGLGLDLGPRPPSWCGVLGKEAQISDQDLGAEGTWGPGEGLWGNAEFRG